MFLPPQYAWFEPVLIASIVVFVIDLIGGSFAFGNKFLARSGFSGNHYGVAASGHNLSIGQDGTHLRTLSNNIRKGIWNFIFIIPRCR